MIRNPLGPLTSPEFAYALGEPFFHLFGLRRREGDLDLAKVKRVLVVRTDSIGDVILTIPFLRELRRNLPEAWISLVVRPLVYDLIALCPYVNEVLTYDWDVGGESHVVRRYRRHRRALKLAWQHLLRRRFDLAIVPRWAVDFYHATFVAYFSGANWRVGYSEKVLEEKQARNAGYDRLLTHVILDDTTKHEVARSLDILRFLGGDVQEDKLELWVDEDDDAYAAQVLRSHAVHPGKPLIAFGPGAGLQNRLWPLERFVAVGSWLIKQYGARILVVGGPGEEPLGCALRQQLGDPVIDVVGRASLRQSSALLKRCDLYVGNDSGPMHMATAIGVPVVEISCHPQTGSPLHANSPLRFGPWGVPHCVLQPAQPRDPACRDGCVATEPHCILGVTLEQVIACVRKMLPAEGVSD